MGSVHSLLGSTGLVDTFVYTDETDIYVCDQKSIKKVKTLEGLTINTLIPLKRDQSLWALHSECRIHLLDKNFKRLSLPEIIGHPLTSEGCRIFLPSSCLVTSSPDKTLYLIADYWTNHILVFDWDLIQTSSDRVIDTNHGSFLNCWIHEEVNRPRCLLQDVTNPSLFWLGSDNFLGLFDHDLNLVESHVLNGKPKELVFHEGILWVLLCNDDGFFIVNGRTGEVLRQTIPCRSFDFFRNGFLLKEKNQVRVEEQRNTRGTPEERRNTRGTPEERRNTRGTSEEKGGYVYTLKGMKGLGKAQRLALMDGKAEDPCELSNNLSSLSFDLIHSIMSYL